MQLLTMPFRLRVYLHAYAFYLHVQHTKRLLRAEGTRVVRRRGDILYPTCRTHHYTLPFLLPCLHRRPVAGGGGG